MADIVYQRENIYVVLTKVGRGTLNVYRTTKTILSRCSYTKAVLYIIWATNTLDTILSQM